MVVVFECDYSVFSFFTQHFLYRENVLGIVPTRKIQLLSRLCTSWERRSSDW